MKQKRIAIFGGMLVLIVATLLFSPLGASVGSHGAVPAQAQGSAHPVLSVSPNPAPNGITSVVISGSGFRANKLLTVGVRGVMPSVEVTTNGSGAFSITYTPWAGGLQAGIYPVDAMTHRGGKTMVVASTMLTVCSTSPCQ